MLHFFMLTSILPNCLFLFSRPHTAGTIDFKRVLPRQGKPIGRHQMNTLSLEEYPFPYESFLKANQKLHVSPDLFSLSLTRPEYASLFQITVKHSVSNERVFHALYTIIKKLSVSMKWQPLEKDSAIILLQGPKVCLKLDDLFIAVSHFS